MAMEFLPTETSFPIISDIEERIKRIVNIQCIAEEEINTGEVVYLSSEVYPKGIKKAVSGVIAIGVSQNYIASGQIGLVLTFGEGIINVGNNFVEKGMYLTTSTEQGIASAITGIINPGQIIGISLESGTGIISALITHI